MTIIRPESAHAINGVQGRMMNATTGGRAKAPGTFASQKWIAVRDLPDSAGWGPGRKLKVQLRFDDECGNGENTFSMTADVYRPGARDIDGGGCLHEEIAKYFPELAHLVRWHLVSTDGPMHYLANATYLASERDHWGLLKGEPHTYAHGLRFNGVPLTHRISEKLWAFIKERKSWSEGAWKFQTFAIEHKNKPGDSYKFAPKYSLVGYTAKEWHEGPFDDETEANEFRDALNTCTVEFVRVPATFGEGKARELDKARSVAVWPEATDEELCAPDLKDKLAARLPTLLAEFRKDIEAAGFLWSSETVEA